MKKIIVAILFLILYSCNSEYEIQDEDVYYRFWSFEQGGWNDLILENADVKSFKTINTKDNLYGKDSIYVYFNNKIVPGADPQTFKYISNGYAIDKNRAYYYSDSITKSSSKGFEIINSDFSKNKDNVFYKTKPLEVCSVDSFHFVFPDKDNPLGRWSTDGCFYYYNNYKVPSKDYENIIIYRGSGGISRDNQLVYKLDKNYFDTNTRTVFVKEKGVIVKDTIDIKTFTVVKGKLKDKFGNIN